jgi:type IV pilus assembly protein PilP
MLKKIIKMSVIPLLVLVLACFSGCKKQEEQAPDPGMVKSFKIDKTEAPKDVFAKANDKPPANPSPGIAPSSENPPVTAVDQPKKPPENFVATEPVAPGKVTATVVGATPTTLLPGTIVSDKGLPSLGAGIDNGLSNPMAPGIALDGDVKSGSEITYNPAGRIDPFEPLFQFKSDKGGDKGHQTIRDARRDKLTPLEKLDISQLKLTAIIIGAQSIAMVQESTGKGHVIKIGTYIGINSGRVVEINKNEVVVEEEVEDLLGKLVVRKRELKLQKPLGEM